MKEKILADTAGEKMTIRWDGERFALNQLHGRKLTVIILNPREMLDLIEFAGKYGGE